LKWETVLPYPGGGGRRKQSKRERGGIPIRSRGGFLTGGI